MQTEKSYLTLLKKFLGKASSQLGAAAILIITLLSSCNKHDHHPDKKYDVLYIQTNDFHENQNAVLAYKDWGDGKLEPLAGSPFYTHGSGVGNPMQALGPLDSDYELRISSDGQFLIVVNSGSNTIAVFHIKPNGELEHVPGSPFPSGGKTPVSVDISGHYVFVVNKSNDPLHPTTQAPNYRTFTIDGHGKLTEVPGAKFETTAGTSPAMALVSHDKKFLFGADFLGFMAMPALGTLRSFTVGNSGMLSPAPGAPYFVAGNADGMNGALGLWEHPAANVLYVGFPLLGMVGVYGVDEGNGALSFKTSVPAGKAACWMRTTKSGNYLYVLNSGDNGITVYNSSNPSSPSLIQTLELKKSGPSYPGPMDAQFKTSQDFSLAFSSSEKILYVVCQHTNKDFSIGNYNYLHSLNVADDGQLTEATDPIQIPVPNTVRPKGSAVIRR